MAGEHLVLDSAIRDWVVFPLMLMVILVGVLRHKITALIKSDDKPLEKEELSHKQLLTRAKRLRGNGRFICEEAFMRRKGYYTAKEAGLLRQEDLPGAANPMANPDKMMGPMKSQMGFFGTNMFMMAFTSYFFDGFVLLRVPFPLTNRFKGFILGLVVVIAINATLPLFAHMKSSSRISLTRAETNPTLSLSRRAIYSYALLLCWCPRLVMLQRGVQLSTLEASYVSSTSWYFLVMFGLKSVINLFLRDTPAQEEAKALQMQMGIGASNMGFDTKKVFQSEADSLDLAPHNCFLDDVEKRLLGSKYPAKSVFDLAGMQAEAVGRSSSGTGGKKSSGSGKRRASKKGD